MGGKNVSNGNRVVTKTFLHCSKCNKRLLERLQNGLFKFIFGGGTARSGEDIPPPIDMKIHGSIQMKCTRRTCRELNTFQYFPHSNFFQEKQSDLSEKSKTDINK